MLARETQLARLVFLVPVPRVFVEGVKEELALSHVRPEDRGRDAGAAIVEIGGRVLRRGRQNGWIGGAREGRLHRESDDHRAQSQRAKGHGRITAVSSTGPPFLFSASSTVPVPEA